MLMYAILVGAFIGIVVAMLKYMPRYRFAVVFVLMVMLGAGILAELAARFPPVKVYLLGGPMLMLVGIYAAKETRKELPVSFTAAWGFIAGLFMLGVIGSFRLVQHLI